MSRPSPRVFVKRYLRRFGSKKTVGSDVKAGLVLGVESVPDGLAAGLLAGVNPLFGLYGYLMGTLGGALATGSVFMTVQVTGAMAVVIADVPLTQAGAQVGAAMATLAVLTGIVMLVLGILKLGSLVRFIPTAVLVGFINAVAISIVLGQLDSFTGYESEGPNKIVRAIDTALHLFEFSWPSLLVGITTIVLIVVLERTPLGALAMVVAIVLASGLASLFNLVTDAQRVQLLSGVAEVPNALPGISMPELGLVLPLIVPALSLALVGLVQGAAISGSIANPNGRYPDPSADFRGQGIANLAAGVFQGMPVGGSMSATALVRAAGAKSALANLVAAAVMAVTILLLGSLIGYVAMPALAGLLMLVGVRTFKLHDVLMVWRTGSVQIAVLTVTFTLTLLIPLQYAVLTGVGLAIILHIIRQSNRITVKRWKFDPGTVLPGETAPPAEVTAGDIVVLVPYGSLFFAAAPVFEAQLPAVGAEARRAVVIIRLRGKDELGSTFIRVLEQYARRLRNAGGVLMLAGVNAKVYEQLIVTGVITTIGRDNVFAEQPRVGEALKAAMVKAEKWVGGDNGR